MLMYTQAEKHFLKSGFYTTVKMKNSYKKIIHQFLINNVDTSHPKELAFQMTVYL